MRSLTDMLLEHAMAIQSTTQAPHRMRLSTPLGPDALRVTGFSGREGLSRLFHLQLECLARNDQAVPFDQLLGQLATLSVDVTPAQPAFFNGLICRVTQGERDQECTGYRLGI